MSELDDFLAVLVDHQLLAAGDPARVMALVRSSEEAWDQVILRLGLLPEDQLYEMLATFSGVPLADLAEEPTPCPDELNPVFLREHRILPVSHQEIPILAVCDPFDVIARNGLEFALPSLELRLVRPSDYDRLQPDLTSPDETDANLEIDAALDADRLADMASSEPVVRRVNKIIDEAAKVLASDIHLEPLESGYRVRLRRDGILRDAANIGKNEGLAVLSRVKILAGLDIAERRQPQDGRFTFPVAGHRIDLRVSTVLTEHGESAVLRLLDQKTVALEYAALGVDQEQADIIGSLLRRPNGLLLVTGPTGSGKTTTLYTFLTELADGRRKVLTIEDPIEYRLSDVSQAQVDRAAGVTFASALRSFLRHDPDVIMVGEIRDEETARIAVQAALTGHLVLSTLHTNDAPSAVTRLRDLGVEDFLIASTLIGAISQRLVARLCSACTGIGCEVCDGTGRKGRIALFEILDTDSAVSEIVRAGGPESLIRERSKNFRTLAEDAATKARNGLLDAEDASRVLGVPLGAS